MTHILFVPCQSAAPFLRYSNFRLWPWNSKARSWVWSRGNVVQSTQYHINLLPFISHQSDQQFLRYSYFEIWPWNIQGQSHEWGQRSRSHIIHSIKPMHFPFVSHQSDQSFLGYGQNIVWPCKNTSEIFLRNLPKYQFSTKVLQNLIRQYPWQGQ